MEGRYRMGAAPGRRGIALEASKHGTPCEALQLGGGVARGEGGGHLEKWQFHWEKPPSSDPSSSKECKSILQGPKTNLLGQF